MDPPAGFFVRDRLQSVHEMSPQRVSQSLMQVIMARRRASYLWYSETFIHSLKLITLKEVVVFWGVI